MLLEVQETNVEPLLVAPEAIVLAVLTTLSPAALIIFIPEATLFAKPSRRLVHRTL